jgi:Carboxypeptidase regulatory-like domain/TonB dependent receptor
MQDALRNFVLKFLRLVVALALSIGTLWAQGGTGELTGLVTDPSGAVLAGVSVNLTNTATGDRRSTVTSQSGVYRFTALPIVGTYTLEASPQGFRALKVADIVLSVGTTVTRDLKLELGAAREQVTVEAGVEAVQTTDSSVSQLIDRRIWQQMPLETRNQNTFIELVAGAVPQDDTNTNRGAAVNGAREGAGNYMVEGVDNNEQGQAGRGQISNYDKGGAATSISPDAIQEYRVITNSFSSEYGKAGGFVTDTVLKSGTNAWHGSAFEYNRIQALTANDFFSDRAQIRDHLVRNQFGGSFGGPIIKDKTFFFGSTEFHRVRQSSPLTTTGTTQQYLDWVKSGGLETWAETSPNGLCNNQIWWDNNSPLGTGVPGSSGVTAAPCPGAFALSKSLGPIFSQLKAVSPYPVANGPASSLVNRGAGVYTTNLIFPVPVYGQVTVTDPQSQSELRWTAKIDHRLSSKDALYGVYLFQDSTYRDAYSGGFNTIGPAYILTGRGQTVGVTWNHTFSPTVLNTARVGYLRHTANFPPPAGLLGVPSYFTIDGMGVDLGLYNGLPQWFTDNQFQYMDSVSFVRGKHSFKTGAEYRRTRNGSTFFFDKYSSVLPWGIEDTVTDLAFSDEAEQVSLPPGVHVLGGAYKISAAVNPTTGQSPNFYRGYRANEFAAFFQDDWRLQSRLTVNLGLRWEYFGPPHNFQPNIDSNLYFGSPVTPITTASSNPYFPANNPFYASVATATFQVRNHEIWNKDTSNFGPRAGLAWDVMGNQRLVARAGAGIMFDRIYNNVFENIRFNPPFFSDNQIGTFFNGVPAGQLSTPGLLTYPFTSLSLYNSPVFQPKPNPRHMDQNLVSPYYEQLHFGLQYDLGKGYVFEPEYIGTFGHKLIGMLDTNTFDGRVVPGLKTTRINPNIGADNFRTNAFGSNYHGLQLNLRKTYSAGLSFNANYTYSKALDDMSDLFTNRSGMHPTDNMNISNDYGPADFDLRHRFVGAFSYELPFMKSSRWIGGWGLNSIVSLQTGHPFSPYSSNSHYDLNKDGYLTDRIVPTVNAMSTINHKGSPADGYLIPQDWGLNPTSGAVTYYQCPLSVNNGQWCDAPIHRNSLTGPGFRNVDFNVTKRFRVTEGSAVTFQANFFNLLNHPNFKVPAADVNAASSFGKSQNTLGDSGGHRITQLALRFDF